MGCVVAVLGVACGDGGSSNEGLGFGRGDDIVVVAPGAAGGPSSATPAPSQSVPQSEEPTFDANIPAADATSVTTAPQLFTDVNVIITADNAYGFGYGSSSALVNYFGGVENITSNDIFACPVGAGPEQYVVPATDGNAGSFLYVVAYADKTTSQGVIGKFFREGADAIFTGNGSWEVCATGQDFDPGTGGPSLEEINQQLVACNAGGGDQLSTSMGWVGPGTTPRGNLVFGEDNSTDRDRPQPGNEFLIACGIDAEARWMWYDWMTNRTTGSPFIWPGGNDNVTRDFLIFRLGADLVPPVVR